MYVAIMWERRVADTVLVGRLEGERPLGRARRRWEDNTVIPRLTKIIRSGITFVSRNVISP